VQRTQGAAEGRVDQVERGPDRDRQQQRDNPVPLLVAGQLEAEQAHRRYRHAIRPAGPLRFVAQRDADDDAETERRHRQVVALELEDRPGDQRGEDAGGDGAGAHGEQRMPAEVRRQHGRGVGTDAEEAGVAQADLAGEADQEIQTEDDHGVDRHAHGEIKIEAVGQHERQHQQDGNDQIEAVVDIFFHAYTRSVDLPPNRPRGMKKRMNRINTKGIASL